MLPVGHLPTFPWPRRQAVPSKPNPVPTGHQWGGLGNVVMCGMLGQLAPGTHPTPCCALRAHITQHLPGPYVALRATRPPGRDALPPAGGAMVSGQVWPEGVCRTGPSTARPKFPRILLAHLAPSPPRLGPRTMPSPWGECSGYPGTVCLWPPCTHPTLTLPLIRSLHSLTWGL